jgi:hypothetical protein
MQCLGNHLTGVNESKNRQLTQDDLFSGIQQSSRTTSFENRREYNVDQD